MKGKMEMGIVSFQVRVTTGIRTFKFKEPLILESEYAIIREDKDSDSVENEICLSHKDLGLSACGKSFSECKQIIQEELAMLWEEYALAPDVKLTPGAIVFKNKLRGMVEGAK